MKLTILIASLPYRKDRTIELTKEILKGFSHFIIDERENISIGKKRTEMLQEVKTEYFCFIDDDDIITEDYKLIEPYLNGETDVISFNQLCIEDGVKKPLIKFGVNFPLNHLCVYKSQFIPEMSFGHYGTNEDLYFAEQIGQAKFKMDNVIHIDKVLYKYYRNTKIKKEYHKHEKFKFSESMNLDRFMYTHKRMHPNEGKYV
jgi:hypothetical protein